MGQNLTELQEGGYLTHTVPLEAGGPSARQDAGGGVQ